MDTYAIEWNALDAFCADSATSPELLERFSTGNYNAEDMEALVDYVKTHREVPQFFANDSEEVEAFLGQFLH